MGAWDVDSFGNDTACDWSYGLEDVKDLSYVERTLDAVLTCGPDDEVPSDDAACAVAAAEVIARLKGNWGIENSYSETTDKLGPLPSTDAPAGTRRQGRRGAGADRRGAF